MKSLSALIEQYKSTPSQVLKDEIFNRVISLEDTTLLDRAESDKVLSEWVIFDSIIFILCNWSNTNISICVTT